MKIKEFVHQYLRLDTYGWVATASALVCAFTGAILAISYDVNAPYLSVIRLVTLNPAASLARNIHYWSAQLFLILTILHIYDHLNKGSESNIRSRSLWLRLVISLVFTFYVMLSGFILKADADSMQAQRIFASLADSIPLIGGLLKLTFIGAEGNLQLMYIQHAATATLIVFVIVFEHARSLKVNVKTLVITSLAIALVSFFFRAPIALADSQMMKGPWYFAGMQEMLHWIANPLPVVTGLIALLIILYIIYIAGGKVKKWGKQVLLVACIFYIMLTITGIFFRGQAWAWQWPWQPDYTIGRLIQSEKINMRSKHNNQVIIKQGQTEGCLACHSGMKGLSESHAPGVAGCASCHRGDPFTIDKFKAHRSMELFPGNLSNSAITCGSAKCHSTITRRIGTSMMATLSGMITVDRYVFGEEHNLDALAAIKDVGKTAADMHLRNLCIGCHLGNEKSRHGNATWLERGGGCNACHLTYSAHASKDLAFQKKKSVSDTTTPQIHPSIDLNISNEKCMSCHSRSGRIALNYEGWHETTLQKMPSVYPGKYRQLPDGRILEKVKPDIHFEKGLACIDCHGSYELMGDGQAYAHKEQAVKVQCADCHITNGISPNAGLLSAADQETHLVAWLRQYYQAQRTVIKTSAGGVPLVNMYIGQGGKVMMTAKLTGVQMEVKQMAGKCTQGTVHERLSCNACHTQWAPQCLGCHTSYEKQTAGFDMIKNMPLKGTWVEYTGEFLHDLPVLGVNERAGRNGTIQTLAPGMIMSLDKGSYVSGAKESFHRLYAPVSAHTTSRQGRSCKSCHNDPLALGYGRGELNFEKSGKWKLLSIYESDSHDGLPKDAWTGFLRQRKSAASTRTSIRPFSVSEQKKILIAGACLTCHAEDSKVMLKSLEGMDKLIKFCSKKCILPDWVQAE